MQPDRMVRHARVGRLKRGAPFPAGGFHGPASPVQEKVDTISLVALYLRWNFGLAGLHVLQPTGQKIGGGELRYRQRRSAKRVYERMTFTAKRRLEVGRERRTAIRGRGPPVGRTVEPLHDGGIGEARLAHERSTGLLVSRYVQRLVRRIVQKGQELPLPDVHGISNTRKRVSASSVRTSADVKGQPLLPRCGPTGNLFPSGTKHEGRLKLPAMRSARQLISCPPMPGACPESGTTATRGAATPRVPSTPCTRSRRPRRWRGRRGGGPGPLRTIARPP